MSTTDRSASAPASRPAWSLRGRTPAEAGRDVLDRAARHARPLCAWILAALLLAAGGFLVHETSADTLYRDDWTWALHRRGNDIGTFLRPHYGHFSLIPIAIYRVLFAIGGLTDYRPFRATVILLHLTCVVVVFLYARRRVGDLLALLLATLLLFFGPGAQNILWPFQIGFLLSLAAGGAALLAVDRRTRAGDVVAAVMLAVSLASSGLGIPVALGIWVETLLARRGRRALWTISAPLLAYLVWWVAYQTSQTGYWGTDVYLTPAWVLTAPMAVMGALLGLGGASKLDGAPEAFGWGAALGVLVLTALAVRVARAGTLTPRMAGLVTTVLVFWTVTALGRALFGPPVAGRYLYVGAFLMLLIAAEAGRGVVVSRRAAAVLVVVVAFAAVSNLGAFRSGAADLRAETQRARVELGALGIGRPLVGPGYVSQGFFFDEIVAGPYFRAVRDLGSPAASEAEIAASTPDLRAAADAQLAAIHRIALLPVRAATQAGAPPTLVPMPGNGASATPRGSCLVYRPPAVIAPGTAAPGLEVVLPVRGLLVRAGAGAVTVGVRRFADAPRSVGAVAPGGSAIVAIGSDLSRRPWYVRVGGERPASLCARG